MHARPRALPGNQRYPKRLGPVFNPISQMPATTDHRSPITKKTFGSVKFYGLGRGVGRGLAVGPDLGVGVGRGVAVGVAVAVGVGVGDPPLTAAKMSTRPQP